MSEMVKRIARAICNEWGYDFDDDSLPGGQEAFLSQARAAIEAMREPTEEMNSAATDVGPDRTPEDYWHVMIGAALKTTEPVA